MVEAVAVPVADMIASANVVFDDDGGGQTNESRENDYRAWLIPHSSSSISRSPPLLPTRCSLF